MSKHIVIAYNAVIAKIIDPDKSTKLLVQQYLSYRVAGAENSAAFKLGNWDGRSSFFDYTKGTFPRGFVDYVADALSGQGYVVRLAFKPYPEALGLANPIVDAFGNDNPDYDYQMKTVEELLKRGQMIAQVATGGGKCLGKDTPVMMFDGSIKAVQDIQVGDLLMGPDSTPRTVLSTCVGQSELYKVTPTKGDSYVVNDAHILSLKKTSRGYRGKNRDGEKYPKGEVVNINVVEYLKQNKTFKHIHKGWRTSVDFQNSKPLAVDPYFVGLLLGDGSINGTVSLTTADIEIVDEIERQAKVWGLGVMKYEKPQSKACSYHLTAGRTGGKPNPLTVALRGYGLGHGFKFIPHEYKTASRKERLELLAGLLDTDGYYDQKCMYLTLKEERLLDDAIFLARSLGFAAYKKEVRKTCHNNGVVGTYFATVISGKLEDIPVRLQRRKANPRQQKKDHLVTGLKVESIGFGDYYGFELDGDHLFLLGDFTVTHNTKIARLAFARINRPTLFLTTRSILMYQMASSFKNDLGVECSILGDGHFGHENAKGGRSIKKISCGMVQTLAARLRNPDPLDPIEKQNAQLAIQDQTRKLLSIFEFVILEEAHEASGESYYEIMKWCKNAHYRLALTATPFMKDDEEANMRLMACSGSIGIKVSEDMLIARGILAKPHFKFVAMKERPSKLLRSTPWQAAYRIGIVENEYRNHHIVYEASRAAQRGMTVAILIQHKKHGELLRDALNGAGIKTEFIFGENDQAERKAAINKLANGEIQVLIGSTILDVGVDVPAIGMVILAGGGKAEVALRQRIGRGLRKKKSGPNVALVVDFTDEGNMHLSSHAKQRQAIIRDTKGFGENIIAGDFDFTGLGL